MVKILSVLIDLNLMGDKTAEGNKISPLDNISKFD
jgi:hypothetical protein